MVIRVMRNGYEISKFEADGDNVVIHLPKEPVSFAVSWQERVLVEAGKYIYAIKSYRERTGVGLKEAKDAIDAVRDEITPGWRAAS